MMTSVITQNLIVSEFLQDKLHAFLTMFFELSICAEISVCHSENAIAVVLKHKLLKPGT